MVHFCGIGKNLAFKKLAQFTKETGYFLCKKQQINFYPELLIFIFTDGSEVKSNRLLSNLFGLLGHESCATSINDRNVTGQCYNEMECLLK